MARIALWLLVVGLLLAACAPARDSSLPGSERGADLPTTRTLVVATDTEPTGFGEMFAGSKSGPEHLETMLHRSLAEVDDRGNYIPGVAVALPAQDAGTWKVFPDGRAETTWTLHPTARWHDGAPLSAADVVFSWRVYLAPDVPYKQRRAASLIEDIDVIDGQTVNIRWKSFFLGAGRLTIRELALLPHHLLEESFVNDRVGFVNSTYWTTGYIGVGPYRLLEWEPGAYAQVAAYDGFYGQAPRIRNITFRFIPDINTAMANILANEVDVWLGSSLGIGHAQILKAQWEARGDGQVITYPRLIFLIRFAPGDARVADVRVRKALYHGMDRETIVRDLYGGLLDVAHNYIAPGTSGFEEIDARTTKYPYDGARAAELLAEVGWRRGGDGVLRNERGDSLTFPFGTTVGNQERETLQAVVADMWKALGVDVRIQNSPLSVTQDPSYNYPTTDLSGFSTEFEGRMLLIDSRNLKTPQNPRGSNTWGYANEEVDRLLDEWVRTTDRRLQIPIEAAVIHRLSEDLPILPINYRIEAITARKGLVGVPKRTAALSANNTWNVETWERTQ